MKSRTKIKSKVAVAFLENFPKAYNNYTLKHVSKQPGVPEANLTKPLAECKVALLSTAGVHLKTDIPFDLDIQDHTIRIVPGKAQEEELTVTHMYYDTKFAKKDTTIVFPIQQLKELEQSGVIGSVSDIHIGLYGGIMETEQVEKESIPKVVELFKNKDIDVALLVPG
ncbi:glycine/sarcosine/betaine reductase selenoprotein B family protein [Planococcus shenhongbingii]|uniref:Glycine/sarcosine/betaine reductase selenoprotein B family protein n=1 Tax=Planococcus shenhongbingii TaxID=3058398 RepID=A0ABT8N8Y0_9BACL|nr:MULTISPECIES: glycine/sarcosine/betaine reductase selenoprotein B family protein [unclassified Planococcus (in: firmicutes)]MDN7244117.1 glycine/sarcosine/betaine reductase selenoprotein B family protein [Planococcus sp. N017]WKA57294.1 glycine/sarcosine/betaine reductase selenoprotein B family protein [Planococcus sp. N016]